MFIGWTTVETREQADTLATQLVEAGLVACAQIDGPITSVYRWKGKTERAEEFRLTLKIVPARVKEIEAFLERHHPYDTPQWVAVRAEQVSEKYLSWARANSTSGPFNESQPPI